VLCEKPIALTLEDADAMRAAAEEAGVQIAISYQYRGRSKYRLCRDLVASGDLAGPLFVRFVDCREVRPKTAMHRTSENGGPVIDMAGHYFDLMRYITASEPVSVFASGHVFGRGKSRLDGIEDLAIDAAEIQVRYTGGHVLSVLVHWGLPEKTPSYTNEFITTGDAVVIPGEGDIAIECGSTRTVHRIPGNPPEPAVVIAGLVDAIEGDRSQMVTVDDGRTALAVSLAALESIRSGKAVSL
jgi:predicted dehydrogenase